MTTDVVDRLRAANPVPVLGRAGAAPVFAAESRSSLRSRWITVVVAAFVGAALVGAPALAIGLGLIDFTSAEPAPPKVVKDFESLSAGAPRGMDPAVVAGEARQVTVEGRLLWVAPTRAGGLCYGWDGGSGGCDKLGTVPLNVTWLGRARTSNAVEGYAHAPWIDSVEIRLDDGTSVRPQVTWISKPIDAGFFWYLAPANRHVSAVLGFRDGEEVIGEGIGARAPHPYAKLDRRTELGEVATANGPVRLWTAPTKTDGRCVWLEFRGAERAVAPCLPPATRGKRGSRWRSTTSAARQSLPASAATQASSSSVRPGARARSRAMTGSSSRRSSKMSSKARFRRSTKLESPFAGLASSWRASGARKQ